MKRNEKTAPIEDAHFQTATCLKFDCFGAFQQSTDSEQAVAPTRMWSILETRMLPGGRCPPDPTFVLPGGCRPTDPALGRTGERGTHFWVH